MNKQVFLIDDDDIFNFVHRRIIERELKDVSVSVYNVAREALAVLESAAAQSKPLPQFIFLDLNMPGFNGWDFMEVFTQRAYSAKIFILTSSIDPEDRDEATFSVNISGFYSKPLLPEMLKEAFLKTAVR